MRKSVFLLLLSLPLLLPAQNLGISFPVFAGISHSGESETFFGGAGLSLDYQHPISFGELRASLEFRAIDWSNQANLLLGHNITYWENESLRLSGTASIQLGSALFRNNPLFAWGLEYQPEVQWQSGKRFNAHLGIGIRYSTAPGYQDYGPIYSVLEIPIRFGIGFRLAKR